jgi:Xaa-Pro aminopeptidase
MRTDRRPTGPRREGRTPATRLATLLLLPVTLLALPAFMTADAQTPRGETWSESPTEDTRPLFTADFPAEEFEARRAKVYDAIGPNAFAVVQGAAMPLGFVRFRQYNQFYYLSGIEAPHAYLVLDGARRRALLFLPPRNERREYGEGTVLAAEDAALIGRLAGIDEVHPVERLVEHVRGLAGAGSHRKVFTLLTPPEGLSTTRNMALRTQADRDADPLDGQTSRHTHFLARLQSVTGSLPTEDLNPILDALREIKSPRELDLIRTSTRLHGLAILEAMRSTAPGITEYELEAIARYVFWQHGAQGDAYYALAHIGANAHRNHYHAGVRASLPGDMILLDYGADYRYYVSDMARMWPADGRFNAVQRELYGFYLAFYEAILHAIRPNVTAQQVKLDALEEIDRIHAGWQFSRPEYAAAAAAFVEAYREGARNPNTRLGHGVGMAAHDPGSGDSMLRPGMVFVIEPQFRVPEELIYVRLEDTIAITEDGVEIMSDFVPRDIESIERLVQQRGLRDQFPRLLDRSGEFLPAARALVPETPDR